MSESNYAAFAAELQVPAEVDTDTPANSASKANPPTESASLPAPWIHDWPSNGIEVVNKCPLCGSDARTLLYDALVDQCFRVSPGRWRLWRCASCSAAYLSPRPTADTIHAAYSTYYTHAEPPAPGPNALQRIRRKLSDGYANQRYGCKRDPESRWGPVVARVVPLIAWIADREFRHLPTPTGFERSLLDVGCGDGGFLANARTCGWDVLGLEPDPKAAAIAQQRGVPVRIGGLESLAGEVEAFDVITLSHVIEHLHDPVQALRDCRRLLRPGGQLWLETPNVDSLSHQIFGRSWRGLEAPRHLVLFSPRSLRLALAAAGFGAPTAMRSPSPRLWMFEHSLAIANELQVGRVVPLPRELRRRVVVADLLESVQSPSLEFLTVVSRRD